MKPAAAVFLALCLSGCASLTGRSGQAASEPWQALATCAETRPVPDAAADGKRSDRKSVV